MKYICLTSLLFLLRPAVVLSQNAPYNPDADNNQLINTSDLGSFLAVYGGPFFSEDDDVDVTNELQQLSISGDTLFISNGNYVLLPQPEVQLPANNQAFPPGEVESEYIGNMGYVFCWYSCDTLNSGGNSDWHMVTDVEIFSKAEQFYPAAQMGATWYFIPENSPLKWSGANTNNSLHRPYFQVTNNQFQLNAWYSYELYRCLCTRWSE